MHVIYIDLKKAFDSVSHTKLLYKLNRLGFSNELIFWISSFLSSRFQRVKYGSLFSDFKPGTSGVPQKNVIDPLLFSLFINDLAKKELNCQIKLFANDLKIYKVIRSPFDCEMLQCALRYIELVKCLANTNYCHKVACLVLNRVEKCYHNYILCEQCLPFVILWVDLGINVDSKLLFVQLISIVVSIAKARCSLKHKGFSTNDANTSVKAYSVYVRLLLEYNCAIWSPCFKKDINLIKSVQLYFTRKTYHKLILPDTCYNNRLFNLGLQRFELN